MEHPDCLACQANADSTMAPGGRIRAYERWYLEHRVPPSPILGWLVLKTIRHTEGIVGMDPDEARELGPILEQASKALQQVSGAEQVYVCCFTEVVPHLHVHLIPRLAGATMGPDVFALQGAIERGEHPAVALEEMAAFAEKVSLALGA